MGKRRSEYDGLVTGFRERSRPTEDKAGGRLPRDLRDGAANDQTHLLAFRQVVMSDMAHLNRLILQNQQRAAALVQPQQQRLIADPQANTQPRALQRRSPSVYAWQVVMAANRLMGKELGAGARCRLRKGTRSRLCATSLRLLV